MNTFIEINIVEDADGVGYSAVLDSDGEPVVLCDGNVDSVQEALDMMFSAIKTNIR